MLVETLKELCALDGVSGMENEVREYIKKKAAPFADEIITDNMGNLLVFKKGKAAPKKKLMLAAHMDEVGIIITSIENDGCLGLAFVGSVDSRVVMGHRVRINGVPGVITCKAVHFVKGEEKVAKAADLYVDIGATSKEEAQKHVSLGDVGVFDSEIIEFGDGFLKAKAIDDRIGCAIMLELIKEELSVDTWFAFTVQEEVGMRGSEIAAFRIAPETALIIEGTTAADLPGVTGCKRVCSPGKGPVVPFMDRCTIYQKGIYNFLTCLADKNGIPWQTKQMVAGGTDASVIQRSRSGAEVIGISAAVRNLHSPSCVAKIEDLEQMLKLAGLFLNEFKNNLY